MSKPASSAFLKSAARVLGLNNKITKNNKAFNFLKTCDESGCRFNWTSASSKRGPSISVINYVKNFDFRKLGEDAKDATGDLNLKKVATDYFFQRGILCDTENIIIDNSTFVILNQLYKILKLPGSKKTVLIPTPTFGYYYTQCYEKNIRTEFLPLRREDEWKITPENLDKTLRSNSSIKVILLNFPSNPTGTIMTKSNVKDLYEVLKSFPEVQIFSDEIFKDISRNKEDQSCSFAEIEDMKDRTVVLSGVSKTRGLDSIRVSIARAPKEIVRKYDHSGHMLGFPSLTQGMAAMALTDNKENQQYLSEVNAEYEKTIEIVNSQIDLINKKLSKHFNEEDQIYIKPYIENPKSGNFYLLDFSGLRKKTFTNGKKLTTGLDVAEFLLEKADMAIVPGEYFFIADQDMVVRIPLSRSDAELEKGLNKICETIIENLRNPLLGLRESESEFHSRS